MGRVDPRATRLVRLAALTLCGASLTACASIGPHYPIAARGGGAVADNGQKPASKYSGYHVGKPYEINGRWYTPQEQPDYDEVGTASWYGEQFHNHYTADGEVFDMHIPSAAHKTLPLPSLVEVTNLANGRKIVVRVNDRGPFVGDRLIDMSKEAAVELGFLAQGVTQVRVRYLSQAPANPGGVKLYDVSNDAPTPAKPAKAKPAADPPFAEPTQMAAAGAALLGSDIDDRPLQSTPADVAWSGAAPRRAAAMTPAKAPIAPPAPPPATASDIDSLMEQLASAPVSLPAAAAPTLSAPSVQAGAFSTRANAERAAAHLAGQTQIVPSEQSGRTLYKVMVSAPSNPDAVLAGQ